MMQWRGGRIVIECDSCNETFEGDPGEQWETVWPAAKADGWRTSQIAGEWLHGCRKHGKPT